MPAAATLTTQETIDKQEAHRPPEPEPEHETPPEIVDCDVLEAAKENVQPLGTGRRVSALSTVLATPHARAQRDAGLVAQRRRLRDVVERALREAEGEGGGEGEGEGEGSAHASDAASAPAPDPLTAYTTLVTWTLEHYPQGPSVDSGLLSLLEEATRVLLHHRAAARWRGDARYLRLWLLYAGFVDRPTEVYRFLVRNEVGTGVAMLYEEWAAVLERDGRRREADEAYKLGIARRAEPLEHLRARHEEFQKRMMSNTIAAADVTATVAARGRGVLGSRCATRVPATTATATATPRGGLQVFVDPTGSAGGGAGNTWTDLGTGKTRVKENVPETRKLVGTTVRRTGVRHAGVSAGRIPVFRDPVEEAAGDECLLGGQETSVMRVVPGSASEMEALRKDPLKNYRGRV